MLKIYLDEQFEYPEFREVHLCRVEQYNILKKLCKHFKVCIPDLQYSHKRGVATGNGGGSYRASYFAPVIKIGKVTTLATLVHEFAHHLDFNKNNKIGHRKSFWKCLKKSYTFAKRYLPKKEATNV